MVMTDYPLVTIITPSYNQAPFLEETILSVLSQAYPNLEYWVIDGGSTDNSLEIIQNYENQLSGWLSEPDRGQGDAINKGFRKTTGEIVAWINSDDFYRPGAIKRAVSIFQKYPEVGLVYSDVDSVDEDGEIFNRMTYDHWQLRDLMAFNIIGQASVFFRRSVLEKAGYLDPSYHYLLDHHLWLRMALITRLKYLPGEVWAAARIHPGAKNVISAEKFGEEAYRLIDWMKHEDNFEPYLQGNLNRIWAGAHRLNAFYLLDGGKPGAALKAYGRGLWKYPPAIIKDWRRVIFAILSPLKLTILREIYLENKRKKTLRERHEIKDNKK